MKFFRTFEYLPAAAKDIRQEVFVSEQGFEEEFDDIDRAARHIVMYDDDGKPITVCRYFWDENAQAYAVGRIAVLKRARGRGCGAAILREAERQVAAMGGRRVVLAAQVRAKGFYQKQGYEVCSGEFYEEFCPHVYMCKQL